MHFKNLQKLPLTLALLSFTPTTFQLAAQPPPTQTASPLPAVSPTPAPPATPPAPTPPPIPYDTQPLPGDPDADLELASHANGLGGDALKPWHLKAHFQTYDAEGKSADKGQFEMWWAAPDHYRVTYTSDRFTATFYRTSLGLFRLGPDTLVPYGESLIWDQIMRPLHAPENMPSPARNDKKVGKLDLRCLDIPFRTSAPSDEYCLDAAKPLLRLSNTGSYDAAFNQIKIFQHRFLAFETSITDGGLPVLTLLLDDLRSFNATDLAELTPPAQAGKLELVMNPVTHSVPNSVPNSIPNSVPNSIPNSVTHSVPNPITDSDSQDQGPLALLQGPMLKGRFVSGPQPTYPEQARQRRAQGNVRIEAILTRQGSIRSAIVVHDPDPALTTAAIEAVSHWAYTPFTWNGQPVDVPILLKVTFTLNPPPAHP